MNNTAFFRSLVIFAVCVPLAIFVGYQLTDPMARSTYVWMGLLVLVLAFPILLQWHHFLLIASWNMAAVLFFLPGMPSLWMPMVLLSLGIAVLQRATSKDMRFINVPQLTWPLIFMAVVVLVTAKFTGGIGIRALGSEVYGGKRYVILLGSILGYFAMTSHRIPPQRAGLYVAVFFLSGLTGLIGDLFSLVSPSLYFLFLIFPPNLGGLKEGFFEVGRSRLGGAGLVSFAVCFTMLARYGIRGILNIGRPWRLALVVGSIILGLFGGYRGIIITLGFTFFVQFFLEGLHKTKLFPALLLGGLLLVVVAAPFASKLPYMVQRTLTVLPLNWDPFVKADAQSTVDWRLELWTSALSQVPQYFWLGKGFGLSAMDFDFMHTVAEGSNAENWGSAVAGDFHNGPLSVIIPFGVWGAIAFLWFTVAGFRVLYSNYRFGPSELHMYNTLLLATFTGKMLVFFTLGGGIQNDLLIFCGYLGLSVSLNGGVCRPSSSAVPEEERTQRFANIVSRTRPAFQR